MRLMEAKELATILQVNRQRVYELARRNVIPVVRVGSRQYRFDADAIRKWIERGGRSLETTEAEGGVAFNSRT